ncbi:MAG: ribonuclease E/G [Bacillota bacterium]
MQLFIDKNIFSTKVLLKKNKQIYDFNYQFKKNDNLIGNIYLGKIVNICKNIRAIFVDIGLKKNAYLDFNDLKNEFSKKDFHIGKEIFVQIKKNPIDDKGAKISQDISIAFKNFILLFNQNDILISRKIDNKDFINDLKEYFRNNFFKFGVIVRTKAENTNLNTLKKELDQIKGIFENIVKNKNYILKDRLVYENNKIYQKFINDYYEEIEKIVSNDKQIINSIKFKNKKFDEKLDLSKILKKQVNDNIYIDKGINLKFDYTEALTVIDVNSGKYISKQKRDGNFEINKIALINIARLINVKNVSGIIIIDLINLKSSKKQSQLIKIFNRELKNYKVTTNVYGFTKLGLFELTRKYESPSLFQMVYSKKNNQYKLSKKYLSDIIFSKLRKEILNTNGNKFLIQTKQYEIDYLKKNKIFNDYFDKLDITLKYKKSNKNKIKHII